MEGFNVYLPIRRTFFQSVAGVVQKIDDYLLDLTDVTADMGDVRIEVLTYGNASRSNNVIHEWDRVDDDLVDINCLHTIGVNPGVGAKTIYD